MPNLNLKQWLAILGAILGVLITSTAQLTDIFGAGPTKIIVSTAAMLNSVINSVLAAITGQTAMIKDVAALPGVETIRVNAKADPTLASIAVDPAVHKVEALPQAEAVVQRTAGQ